MNDHSSDRFHPSGMKASPLNIRWLAIILGVSVLLRVGVAFYLGDIVDAPSLLTDQRSYHALGERLITGHGFSFDRAWYPFTPANTPTAHWSFLYSLFVAAVYGTFGVHPLAVRLVQAVLGGVLLPWLVFRLTRRLFAAWSAGPSLTLGSSLGQVRLVPYAAAAIAAVYAYFVLYAATLMTETFFIIALLWSLEIGLEVVAYLQKGVPVPLQAAVRLGLSLGIAALLRQSILPWVPIFFAYVLWMAVRRHRLVAVIRSLAVSSVLLAVFILPWTYRNYRVYGTFLLLNSNAGYAMYSAQHPMHGTHFREFDAAPLPEGIGWGNEAVMDSQLMRIGIQFVLDDPVRYALLSLSRVRAFFEFWPTSDTTLLNNIGRVGSYGVFLPFILYGLYLVFRGLPKPDHQAAGAHFPDWRFVNDAGLIFLFVVVYTTMHLLTWAMVRYRLPVDAVMLSFAGWGLASIVRRLSAARQVGRQSPDSVAGALKPETVPRRRSREGEWH